MNAMLAPGVFQAYKKAIRKYRYQHWCINDYFTKYWRVCLQTLNFLFNYGGV